MKPKPILSVSIIYIFFLLSVSLPCNVYAKSKYYKQAHKSLKKVKQFEKAQMPTEAKQAMRDAVKYMEQAVNEDPLDPDLHMELGQMYLRLTRPNRIAATKRFKSAVSLKPSLKGKIADEYIAYGIRRMQPLTYEGLIEVFNQAIEFDPSSRNRIFNELDGQTKKSYFVLYCMSYGAQQKPYRDKLLASNDPQLLRISLKCHNDPIVKTQLGHLYAEKAKIAKYKADRDKLKKKAKEYLSESDYQKHFPPPAPKKWQTVPGSEKTFVGKGIDRDEYELKIARWGLEIKQGHKIIITSDSEKAFYVGEGNEFKKFYKKYSRVINFTPNNIYSLQAYAEKGDKLHFELQSLQSASTKTIYQKSFTGRGFGEKDYVLTASFGTEIPLGSTVTVYGSKFEVYDRGVWKPYSNQAQIKNTNGTKGKFGVKAPKGESFKVVVTTNQ